MRVSSNLLYVTLQYAALSLIFSLGGLSVAYADSCSKTWPAWESFKQNMISKEGRVIDGSSDLMKTTSEGQSYALFFSLVANDRATFEMLLNWTEQNQSQDDMSTHLPGWSWGKRADNSSGSLDDNSASDADLWMAYALGEAGRLWDNRRYVALSSLLADRILGVETIDMPGLGLVLLPGATGFTPSSEQVRLNPSYLPIQLLRWFAARSTDKRWDSLLNSSQQVIVKSAVKGYAPDWIIYDKSKGFLPDNLSGNDWVGSYDAIRVYLWAGMLNRNDANQRVLMDTLRPMARLVEQRGTPPESINPDTGDAKSNGPVGFSAAIIPFLEAAGMNRPLEQQLQRIAAEPAMENSYYDQVLGLYALGWHENRYRFDPKGNLTPSWISTCK